MIEVVTDTGSVQVNYTVRGPSKETVYSWLRDLYLTYPVAAHATSHSEPREEKTGTWVTYVSRFV
jgi:hypothetical protein